MTCLFIHIPEPALVHSHLTRCVVLSHSLRHAGWAGYNTTILVEIQKFLSSSSIPGQPRIQCSRCTHQNRTQATKCGLQILIGDRLPCLIVGIAGPGSIFRRSHQWEALFRHIVVWNGKSRPYSLLVDVAVSIKESRRPQRKPSCQPFCLLIVVFKATETFLAGIHTALCFHPYLPACKMASGTVHRFATVRIRIVLVLHNP